MKKHFYLTLEIVILLGLTAVFLVPALALVPKALPQMKSLLIATPDYLIRFWNSVYLTLPVVIGQICISVLTAYGLSLGKGKLKKTLLVFYLVMMLMPYQVTVIPNYYAIKSMHLLNTSFAIWLPGIFSPFPVFILERSMSEIPVSIKEAAKTDGASDLKILFHIVIPLCKGQITALSLLVMFDYWNQVELPLIMFTSAFKYPLSSFLSQIRDEARELSFAAALIFFIPVFLFSLLGTDELKKGLGQLRYS